MIISRMLMCEVLTIETNCSGWGLNAEYEFKIWPQERVVERLGRCVRPYCDGWGLLESFYWSAPHLCGKDSSSHQRANYDCWNMCFNLGKHANSLPTQGWIATYMRDTANEPKTETFSASCKYEAALLSASIIFSPHWAQQNNNKSFHRCAEKLQRVSIH